MDPDRVKEIAKMGAAQLHKLHRAHTWTSEEAKAASAKGALARAAKKANV